MKEQINQIIDELQKEIIQLGDDLFSTPELGFKEFQTKERLIAELKKHDIGVDEEYFETGFEASIRGEEGATIGLIAELDAIVTKGHPCANPETQAAHSCGHSIQCSVMCAVLIALKKSGLVERLGGTVKVFFTPAEEFCDMEYRQKLVEEGKLQYYSGKENMLAKGCFDTCDVVLSIHSMGEGECRYSINTDLAGFTFKRITFLGKASHAAVLPHEGVNALNAFALFQSAMGMLRETFVDKDRVRFHGYLREGGDSVNSIPAKVIYECYIRSVNPATITNLSEQVEKTAYHCAHALNADVQFDGIPGYYPLHQSREVNQVVLQNLLAYTDEQHVYKNAVSMAAGDVGDVSLFKPTIQLGVGGIRGRIHGDNLEVVDKPRTYIEASKVIACTVLDLLENAELTQKWGREYKRAMSIEEYCNSLKAK